MAAALQSNTTALSSVKLTGEHHNEPVSDFHRRTIMEFVLTIGIQKSTASLIGVQGAHALAEALKVNTKLTKLAIFCLFIQQTARLSKKKSDTTNKQTDVLDGQDDVIALCQSLKAN